MNTQSLALWNHLNTTSNSCISPLSIYLAVSLAYVGSRGITKLEMEKALGFESPEKACKQISETLKLIAASANRLKPTECLANIANNAFLSVGEECKPAYLEVLEQTYGIKPESVDYSNTVAAAKSINAWVEKMTNNKIKDLIQANALNKYTRLILANAIYLKASWEETFKVSATLPRPFKGVDGATSPLTMRLTTAMSCKVDENLTAISLQLRGGFQFNVFMPEVWEDFKPKIEDFKTANTIEHVQLELPKFKIEGAAVKLSDVLHKMGMASAFGEQAEFQDILKKNEPPLSISEVVHKTFVDVNEAGLEAAAATATIMLRCSSFNNQPDAKIIKINRPFFFTITHTTSQTTLFFGQILNL